jgi:hypothetical protein
VLPEKKFMFDQAFKQTADAFERDAKRPELQAERADVFAVLQGASRPANPNPRRFEEPRPDYGQPLENH